MGRELDTFFQVSIQAMLLFIMKTKKCTKCHEILDIVYFSKSKSRYDGLNPWCKKCSCINSRNHYIRNKNKILIRHHKYNINNKDKILSQQKEYYNRNHKYIRERLSNYYYTHKNSCLIYTQVREAIKKNIINRDKCAICQSKNNLDAHHPDYSKPLEIIPLCRSCHSKLHQSLSKTLVSPTS